MIKQLKLLLFALFIGSSAIVNAQCVPFDTLLETQADVDDFVSNYSNCAIISHNLIIGSNSGDAINDPIVDISELSFITTVEKNLTIQYTELTNLNGLQNLTAVGESFNIQYMEHLTALDGLDGLTSIGANTTNGNLLIYYNPVLTDLIALQNLNTMNNGTVSVQYCDTITSLIGLENIEGASISYIVVRYNPQLTNCSIQSLCEALNLGVPTHNIKDNAIGCNNDMQIVAGCSGYSGCPTENITLETQTDVDYFLAAYQNCTSIEVTNEIKLYIGGSNVNNDFVNDISGFSQFTNMELDNFLLRGTHLTNLEGLQGLTVSNRGISISSNPNLTSLTGLDNLNAINPESTANFAQIDIAMNPMLSNINSLSNLSTADNLYIDIYDNDALVSLSGLDNIDATNIENYSLSDNDNLSICNVNSLCNAIANGVDVTVENNAPGCNNITEVSVTCGTDECPPGDVILASQAEVDAFVVLYPDCTSISGALTINGTDITNLTGLANIQYVLGDVIIQNTQLTSLNDLSLIGVNGQFEINGNTQLATIAALSNITSLGSLRIVNNDNLISLNGLENIESINTDATAIIGLEINGNNSLTDITALETLATLNGSELIIDNNTALTTLSGLDAIWANTISNLSIQNNSSLSNASTTSICIYLNNSFPATISGNASGAATIAEVEANCNLPECPEGDVTFETQNELDYFLIQYPNCTQIDGDLTLTRLQNNEDFSSLSNITEITGWLNISYIDHTNLSGLENLRTIAKGLDVSDCDNLINLQGLNGLTALGTSPDNYLGFIIMRNSSLQNFGGLEGLTTLNGDIDVQIKDNPALINLQGLNNLTSIITPISSIGSISRTFSISNNENLTSLDGLNSLQTIVINFRLEDLPSLASVSALSSLTSIAGDVYFQECDALTSFSGLENLTYIDGDLFIRSNDLLGSLDGLENLQSIEAFQLTNNSSITNIQALNNLTTITNEELYNSLDIEQNPSLESLDGLEGLTTIGNLEIKNNISLISIEGLQNVTDVGVGIVIYDNVNLTTLTGLNNVQRLRQSPYVNGMVNLYFANNALTNLEALSNLTDPNYVALGIVDEQNLTSLSGLENMNPEQIGIVVIQNNSQLSTCEVESICGYLASNPDPSLYIIENNAPGCDTEIEVIDACTLSVDEVDLETSVISFYPNPTEDDLYIDIKGDIEVKNITIYNSMGQLVRTFNGSHKLMNVSKMDSGVYFVKVNTINGEIYTQKIIKK